MNHIRIVEEDGRVVVEVDDLELFDFVEDHLTEVCGLEHESVDGFATPSGPYRMFFAVGVLAESVIASIERLDPSDVERVFGINGGGSTGAHRTR